MKTIRWGMIGCGDVAEVKSGPGFYKADHSSLVAVMRRNGALAADYARRHGVARWSDDAESIIRAADIDAVYIATLTDSHRDYTLRCARAGQAGLRGKADGDAACRVRGMIEACRDAAVPLWVGYYRRALPRFLKVRDLVESGAIGLVRMVISRQLARAPQIADGDALPVAHRPWRRAAGVSSSRRSATHSIFWIFVFGPIADARGVASNQSGAYRAEDTVVGSILDSSPASRAAARGATPPVRITR